MPGAPSREQAERMYGALSRADLDAFLAEVDPGISFRSLIAEAEGEVFHGHDGVRAWFDHVVKALGGLRFEVEYVEVAGDSALTRVRVAGEVGGVTVPQRMWQAARFREGKAVWWDTFRSEREARAAIGIEGD